MAAPAIPDAREDGMTTTTPVPLYWREDGPVDGAPLLLLHGGPGAHHDYLYPQLLALSDAHRLVTYDQRGGGRSKTDDPTPISCARRWRISRWCGASWRWARRRWWDIRGTRCWRCSTASRRVRATARCRLPERLVLISPAPITRAWRNEFETELAARLRGPAIQALRAELAASGLRESDPVAYRQRSFELSVAGYFADPSRAEALTPFRVTGRVQQSIWDSLGDSDLRPALATLARAVPLPVLVVHGAADPIPLASAHAVADALHARFVELPNCGHVPYVEQPQALFEAMAALRVDLRVFPLAHSVPS